MNKLPKTYTDQTKDGSKLIFRFSEQKDPYDFQDSGYQDLLMEAFLKVDGHYECVGDLKMTYLPTEALVERSKDALLFAERYCEWDLGIIHEDGERDSDLDTSTVKGKLEALIAAKVYYPDVNKHGQLQDLKTQDLFKLYDQVQELTWKRARVKQERDELMRFSISPGIRFINVKEDFQRLGISTALYKATALTLGLNGLKLKRGRTRCDSAEFITPDVLESKGLIVEKVTWPGDDFVTEYLDGPRMIQELKNKPSAHNLCL